MLSVLREYFDKNMFAFSPCFLKIFASFKNISQENFSIFQNIFPKKKCSPYSFFFRKYFSKKILPAATSTASSCSPSATAASPAATLLIPHNIFDVHKLSHPEINFQLDTIWYKQISGDEWRSL